MSCVFWGKYTIMLISELLDRAWPYSWQTGDLAAFNTPDNRQCHVVFELYPAYKFNGAHVEFSVEDRYDITGEGGAHGVFATVLKIIQEYRHRNHISILFMESSEDNRTRLYQHIAKRLGFKQVDVSDYQRMLQQQSERGDDTVADPEGIHPAALIFIQASTIPHLQELGL